MTLVMPIMSTFSQGHGHKDPCFDGYRFTNDHNITLHIKYCIIKYGLKITGLSLTAQATTKFAS